jgi:hypothetical protein
MTQIEDNQSPYLTFAESAAPGTPASGLGVLYVKADGKVYFKNDAGVESVLTGGLLAYKEHRADDTKSTNSATFVDADATNLAVTFIAPASGNVLVRLSGMADIGSDGTFALWNLRDTGGDIAATAGGVTRLAQSHYASRPITITGLTPGTSYTYKWGFATSNVSHASRILIDDGTGVAPPAVMEVWSA